MTAQLHAAAQAGDLAQTQAQLADGANPNWADETGETPLMAAARMGHLEVVQALLAAGADVHARDANDWTALFKACHNPELDAGFAPVAQALVDAGADVNAPGKVGAAPSDIKKGAPAEPPVVEYEEVRHATTELLAAKGPQAVVGLLAEFGVDHAKKLKPEQYQPYVNAATKLMS